ncbi:histidine kinase DhkG [Tieghemostelium lacteum]|uniref:Histidine kinase DhkG n=1 Tax=Tieghemostelium lacteum TaxID=361077 RepID=A0A151ZIW3_TIELA|nr:histidine kinase DhkG [Tieghemostelium lacteum]|eukprot:KYQ93932.1 histidine kinase DhkG [Tieghemostelium lacteum]
MEINLTFTENRAIRVLILPIGDISIEKYREYSNLIKTINLIELSSITRSPNEVSPLEKISWIDGNMLLNFVDHNQYQKSEFEDIQQFKKIYGVIGVVDCKKSKDLLETKRLFQEAVSRYPSSVSSLCCAFDPSDDQPDLNLGENLIMIPNNNDKKSHLIFYLSTLLIDFSRQILKHLEKLIQEPDSNTPTPITTILDQVKSWDEIAKVKKRKLGRLAKLKGDYCLLAGSPLDAIKFYDLSIEATKSNNDYEWLASSYEGYITAVILKRNQEFNSQSTKTLSPTSITANSGNYLPDSQIQVDDQQIRDMANEAILSYNKRKSIQLEIELSLKFACYHVSMDRKIEASDLLVNTYEISLDLPLNERINLTCSIALVYYCMSFKRKFAFYIREAVFLYNKKQENWDKIRHLLMISSSYYQLNDLFSQSPGRFLDSESNKAISFTLGQMKMSKSKQANSKSQQQQHGATKHHTGRAMPQLSIHKKKEGWSVIQRYLLFNLISVSTNLMDSLSVCKYTLYLLRSQYKQISQQKQQEVQFDLQTHSKQLSVSLNTNVHMNSLGLPFLIRVQPLALPTHLEPLPKLNRQPDHYQQQQNTQQLQQQQQQQQGFNQPYIYSPYDNDKKLSKVGGHNQIIWVEDECNVLVTLSNPFSFDIFIQSITLSTCGVPFESYPFSIRIHSLTNRMDIVLTGRPLKPGPLIIKGVFIRSYGLLSEHPINAQGYAISLQEYHELAKKDVYKVDSYDSIGLPTSPPSPTTTNPYHSLVSNNQQAEAIVNKINVIPRMPLLSVNVPTFGNKLNLFAGQICEIEWIFENIGQDPIDYIQLQLVEIDKNLRKQVLAHNILYTLQNDDDFDDFTSFHWDNNVIRSHLPLLPGESFSLAIKILSKPYLIGNQFQIEYSRSQDEYQRKVLVPLQLNISHGPQISNFDIFYSSSSTIDSLNSFLISKNVLSLINNNNNNNNNNLSDHCLLMFDIRNQSSTHTFTIYHEGQNQKFTLSPNSIINVMIPVKREAFPDQLPPLRLPKGQYIKPKKKPTEHEEYLNRLVQFYKDNLIRNIKLKWQSSDNTSGQIYINNINLTPKLVYKLKSDPIALEFQELKLSKQVQVGKFESINIKLTNISTTKITGLILHVQPYQDKLQLQSRSSLQDLTNKIGFIGSLTVPIQDLEAGSTLNHNLQVVFFEKDIYKFLVTCELFKTKQVIPSPHHLTINVS